MRAEQRAYDERPGLDGYFMHNNVRRSWRIFRRATVASIVLNTVHLLYITRIAGEKER